MLTYKLTNIYNNRNKIYIFHRPDKDLKIYTDYSNKPYYYKPDKNGKITGYFDGKFTKTVCQEPYMVKSMAPVGSAESDLNYCKQYMLDKINIERANLKWAAFDIETASKVVPIPEQSPDPVSCITIFDNYSEQYKTFWLEDYKTEFLMLEEFSNYLADLKVDIIVGFNINGYDMPYLVHRYPDFAKIVSPIHEVHYKTGYPIGVGVLDYYTVIKKIYKYKRNTLDYIYSTEFKKELDTTKYRFDVLSPIIKEKNIADVRKIVELEKKLNLIPYVDELRRITKTTWDDLDYYSIMIDNLILQEARRKNVVLPSKPNEEEKIRRSEEEFIGGYVYAAPGRYENVVLVDASGMYPSLINTFNLDPKNLTDKSGENIIKIRNIYIKQDNQAIVPTVCRKLINSRKEIQKMLENKVGEDYEILKKKDEAHKALNNCFTGDTDIVTTEGIKNINDVKTGDFVYNVNPKTLNIEKDEIIKVWKYDYTGDIYNFNGRTIDFSVTPKHRFLCESRLKYFSNKPAVSFQTAEELFKFNSHVYRNVTPKLKRGGSKDAKTPIMFKELQELNGHVIVRPSKKKIYRNRMINIFEGFNFVKKESRGTIHWVFNAPDLNEERLKIWYKRGYEIYYKVGKSNDPLRKLFVSQKDFFRFCGWYVSEGSLYKNKEKIYKNTKRGVAHRIQIAQEKYPEKVETILKNLEFSYYKNKKGFSVCSELLFYWLKKHCGKGSYNKKIPKQVFKSTMLAIEFFKSYYHGDGTRKMFRCTTVSKQLVSDLIVLLTFLGYKSIHYVKRKDFLIYDIFVNKNSITLSNYTKSDGIKMITKKYINDKVYCITTKNNHTVYAGRNGCFNITGQSLYGNLCFRSSRIYRIEIASTITYLARFLIRYTRYYLRKKGIIGIANDTDSGFFITSGNPEDVVKICNTEVIPKWLNHFGKKDGSINFKYEGIFKKIVFFGKKHYVGNFVKSNGEEKLVEKGIGTVRRDTSKYQEKFLESLNSYLLEGKNEKYILSWIKTEVENFKNNSLIDISAPFQLNNNEYKSEPIFMRAVGYTEELVPGFKNQWHDYLYYCYVEPFGEAQRTSSRMLKNKETGKKELRTTTTTILKNVLAFDGNDTSLIKSVDWKKMIEKNIYDKAEKIWIAMGWNLEELKSACGRLKVRKEKKNTKETDIQTKEDESEL